jgi:nucleoside-diphosphate-sugar epimerase
LAGKTEIKLGSISPTRDLNYVKDTVNAFIKIAENEKTIGKVTNVGTGKEISVEDLATKILRIIGSDAKIICDEHRIRPVNSEVERLCADNKRALELTDWRPNYTLDEGLSETIGWLKNNISHYKADVYNV